MSGWREMAEEALRVQDTRDIRDKNPPRGSHNGNNVPIVPNVSPPLSTLKLWRASLLTLHPCQLRENFDPSRWRVLVDASQWWLEGFGQAAAASGWSTGDVFGLHPEMPGCGGLIDRLGENRSLVMDGDRARWRAWGVVSQYNRTAGEGLRPFWEV
ncbi:hypothetical protein AM2010_26 [Pelagerythrobacter marensis]|uniref:Uncharacterized protein n=1 Tax=Pelagerythrobacter marensis TaxID=543877 RepID=A0A0G3X687_9SPHN|nr:hypothetical protein AM2010_26 [Pelagerythrobacter marensis]